MILREHKQAFIYGAFGLLLGAKIIEVLLGGRASFVDWWLLLIGVAAAVIHYLPEKPAKPAEDEQDTLVLRDHPDTERGRHLSRNPDKATGKAQDDYL